MFPLDDQHGRTHSRSEVFGDAPVVILAGAQRATPDAMQAWERVLRPRLPDGVRILGLSNLGRLPFFVPKGMITKGLASQLPNVAVLCDWKGKAYRSLGFPEGAVVAVGVFGASGERLGFVSAEASAESAGQVLALLPP
jgi:hypothetical protein